MNKKSEKMGAHIERINLYLNVADLSASLRYYVDVLDFDLYSATLAWVLLS
jgi:hypothetical protein